MVKLGCATLLGVLFCFLAVTASAEEIYGKWLFFDKTCNCSVLLSIEMWQDGSPIGTLSFPTAEYAAHNILLDGNHISFSADQAVGANLITYDYDANVSGDVMAGTRTSEDDISNKIAFRATRRKR